MICMFSHWIKAFPYSQADDSTVAKVLLEKIIPTWGTPLKLYIDQVTHFTGQVLQVCYLASSTTFPLCLKILNLQV